MPASQFLQRPGLRISMSAIPGVTRGDAAKALAEPYLFQCPPTEQLDIPRTFSFNRRTTYQGRTRVTRGGSQPLALSFTTVVLEPGVSNLQVTDDHDVDQLVSRLERICDAGWPFQLHIGHPYDRVAELSMYAVLEGVTRSLKMGEDDARYLSMQFVEWRQESLQVRTGKSPFPYTIVLRRDGSYSVPNDPERGTARQIFNTHDEPLTLKVIAKYAYGKPTLGQHIARAQKPPLRHWGSNEQLIKHPRFKKHGGKIVVPEPPTPKPKKAPAKKQTKQAQKTKKK